MKTSELTGALLDYWAGRASNINPSSLKMVKHPAATVCHWRTRDGVERRWKPSSDWAQGGPLLDGGAFCIGFKPISDAEWLAEEFITGGTGRGPTALIAAMRALVASKFGEEVPENVDSRKPTA